MSRRRRDIAGTSARLDTDRLVCQLAVISNEAPPTPALPSGLCALTPTPMKPGEPVGLQLTVVLPPPSVGVAAGVSPVGLVLTVTWAPVTGWPFLLTTISTNCWSPALTFGF